MQQMYRVRMVDRLAGMQMRTVNRLAGGMPSGETPKTLLRLRLGGLQARTGPNSRRVGIGRRGSAGLRALGDTCTSGVWRDNDGQPMTTQEAVNYFFHMTGTTPPLKLQSPAGVNYALIPPDMVQRMVARVNEVYCQRVAAYEAQRASMIAAGTLIPGTGAPYTTPTPNITGGTPGVITTPGNQTVYSNDSGYQMVQQTVAGAGGSSGAPGSNEGGAGFFETWFSGGGTAPEGSAAASLPSFLQTAEGGVNWLLVAAIAAGGYLMFKKR